jgi:phospholipid transport system transporter-binding protein
MAKLALEQQQIIVIGQIDYENAESVYAQGLALIHQVEHWPIQVNLAQLLNGNTLALAVLIQWLRACPAQAAMQLIHVPEKMQGILRASHLEQLMVE